MIRHSINKGDIILLQIGKQDKPVGFTDTGKVILPTKNSKVKAGYAKINSVTEMEKYILCDMEIVDQDYYSGISYEEFLRVLPIHGYKIGFDRTFKSKWGYDEHQIFAYNLEYNTIIVAETIMRANENISNDRQIFNSIDVYCTNVNVFNLINWKIIESGSDSFTHFNLCNALPYQSDLLQRINDLMEKIKITEGIKWPQNESPHLWTYSDINRVNRHIDDAEHVDLWESTIDRILLAPPEVDQIFEGCERMKPVLAKRGEFSGK